MAEKCVWLVYLGGAFPSSGPFAVFESAEDVVEFLKQEFEKNIKEIEQWKKNPTSERIGREFRIEKHRIYTPKEARK